MKLKFFGLEIDFKRTAKEKAPEVKAPKEKPLRKNARFGGSAELEQKLRNRVRKMYLRDKLNYAEIVKYTHTSAAFVSSCIEPHEKRGRGRKDKSEAYADRVISKLEEKGLDI